MCLHLEHPKTYRDYGRSPSKKSYGATIAQADIEVYKYLEDAAHPGLSYADDITYDHLPGDLRSPYRGFVYTPHKVYETQGEQWQAQGHRLNGALYDKNVRTGFHSFKNIPAPSDSAYAQAFKGCKIYKCTIPAGAEYFEGFDDDGNPGYASNQIIVGEEVTP